MSWSSFDNANYEDYLKEVRGQEAEVARRRAQRQAEDARRAQRDAERAARTRPSSDDR